MLINPADAVLTRSQAGYQNLRGVIRRAVFQSLIHEPATYETAYISTDFQSTDPVGNGVCKEYEIAANEWGSAFVPILLKCEECVNLERLVSADRAKQRKLTDMELVKGFQENVAIYKFERVENALELDVTDMTAEEAARRVLEHLVAVYPNLKGLVEWGQRHTLIDGREDLQRIYKQRRHDSSRTELHGRFLVFLSL